MEIPPAQVLADGNNVLVGNIREGVALHAASDLTSVNEAANTEHGRHRKISCKSLEDILILRLLQVAHVRKHLLARARVSDTFLQIMKATGTPVI
eukprot:jgi/Chlat1/3446/Chrsp23S03825